MSLQIKNGDKLYVITRADLSPGYQAVQSMHALRQFTAEHPDIDRLWFDNSNYLGLLSVENEKELYYLMEQAQQQNIKFSIFRLQNPTKSTFILHETQRKWSFPFTSTY